MHLLDTFLLKLVRYLSFCVRQLHYYPGLVFRQGASFPTETEGLALRQFALVLITEMVVHCYNRRLWPAPAFTAPSPVAF